MEFEHFFSNTHVKNSFYEYISFLHMLMSPCVSCCLNLSARLPESTHTAVSPGDLLYLSVLHVPGEGTYGNVLKCTHMATNVTVAVKMMKNDGLLMEQASSEVSKKFQ